MYSIRFCTLTPVGVDGLASVTVITGCCDVDGGFVFLTGDIFAWSFFLNMGIVWSLVEHPKYLLVGYNMIPFEFDVCNVFRLPKDQKISGWNIRKSQTNVCVCVRGCVVTKRWWWDWCVQLAYPEAASSSIRQLAAIIIIIMRWVRVWARQTDSPQRISADGRKEKEPKKWWKSERQKEGKWKKVKKQSEVI